MSEGRHPGLRTLLPPDSPRQQGIKRGYSRHTFVNDGTEKKFEVQGTHLYLSELVGSDIIMVRLDDAGNSWFPLEEGDVIVREYTRFWVRSNSRIAIKKFAVAEATFYASMGPLVVKAPKKYGLRSGFFTVTGDATDTGADVLVNFASQHGTSIVGTVKAAIMKYGGTVLVRNRSDARNMYLYDGEPGAFALGPGQYPGPETALFIGPGELISFTFESRIANLRHPYPANPTQASPTLCMGAAAGESCPFEVTFSRMAIDLTDAESIPDGSGTPALGV